MKATTPMKNSTTNRTIGGTGLRIALAEISRIRLRARLCRDPHFLARAEEPAGGADHALIALETGVDDEAVRRGVGHVHGAALGFLLVVDDEDVVALRVGEHSGLRQHHPLCFAHEHLRARERTRSKRCMRFELDADVAEACFGIDHRSEQAHLALEGLRDAGEIDVGGLPDLHAGEILFGDLAAHLDLRAAREPEEWLAARHGGLPDFRGAREHDAVGRCTNLRAPKPGLGFCKLCRRDLRTRRIGDRGRAAALDLFGGQGTGCFYALGALVFRLRKRSLRFRLFDGRAQLVHLRVDHGLIEARQHLALLDRVARFDEHGDDAAAFTLGADGHVVARGDRAGEGDVAADRVKLGLEHGHEWQFLVVRSGRRRSGLGRGHGPHDGDERQQYADADGDPSARCQRDAVAPGQLRCRFRGRLEPSLVKADRFELAGSQIVLRLGAHGLPWGHGPAACRQGRHGAAKSTAPRLSRTCQQSQALVRSIERFDPACVAWFSGALPRRPPGVTR
jgi:hypothetical protein